jgi:hypothetical protein
MNRVILTEAHGDFFLYASFVEATHMGHRYRDWQVQASQDCKGWWNVASRLIESNEDGSFLGVIDIEDPLEFPSHAEAVQWVLHDANLPGRMFL